MKKKSLAFGMSMMMMAGVISGCGNNVKQAQSIAVVTESPWQSEAVETNTTAGTNSQESITSNGSRAQNSQNKSYDYEESCETEACYDSGYNSYCDYYGYYGSGETYGEIVENRFIDVKEQPVTTFSADVDTASYSNLRRMINYGFGMKQIDDNSVRIEEMLNYFHYSYKGPKEGEPFGVTAEIAQCPWNEKSMLLMLGLQTEAVDFSNAPDSNLVFLLDVSGSMYDDDKLPLLQQSLIMLLGNLSAKDRISIVTYAGDDRVVLRGVSGNDTQTIADAINELEAGGCTNGSAGIVTAYEIAQEYFIEGGNNRVILATDGDLNVGLTTAGELEDLISAKKQSGVYLSVLGFGTGNINDENMETLADKGNGNYSYIDSLTEARKVLVEEMGATFVTVAEDVKLQLEFDPEFVTSYRQIGYENRALANEDFEDDTKDAGEIGAGHSVTVMYEITLADENAGGNWMDLHIRYKEPGEAESTQLDYAIGRRDFTLRPSQDFLFACAVCEVGMTIRDSEYRDDADLSTALAILRELDLSGDEYKQEFVSLVETLREQSR